MEKNILLDLANETGRIYGNLPGDFANKMVKRIRRKFAVKVDAKQVDECALHYKEIYAFGASVFREYLKPKPPTEIFAQPGDVDFKSFVARIKAKFPADDVDSLEGICGWVLYYEYLR
jgi:hypothetical protein